MKKSTLNVIDIVLLTVIFFGQAIWRSFEDYFSLLDNGLEAPAELVFTAADNYALIAVELISLMIAFAYLMWRRIEIKQFDLAFKPSTLPLTLLFIFIGGGVAQLFYAWAFQEGLGQGLEDLPWWPNLALSWLLAALINGFFEEFYFLGLMFAVPKKWLPYSIAFSLLVRFSFHTYQGIDAALGITLFGLAFALLRLRVSSLLPFMLAHSFFDVFGLGLTFLA